MLLLVVGLGLWLSPFQSKIFFGLGCVRVAHFLLKHHAVSYAGLYLWPLMESRPLFTFMNEMGWLFSKQSLFLSRRPRGHRERYPFFIFLRSLDIFTYRSLVCNPSSIDFRSILLLLLRCCIIMYCILLIIKAIWRILTVQETRMTKNQHRALL